MKLNVKVSRANWLFSRKKTA